MYTNLIAGWLLGLGSLVAAVPGGLVARQNTNCPNGNAPGSRQCWTNGFDLYTDHDQKFPDTGNTVMVNLTVARATLSPDGTPREMIVFNGQYPGPAIVANWGDTIQVSVTNNLGNNGTSIHWHGLRQLHSNQMDGTNGITECPIAPGQTKVYTFKATQYGTSWYHAHYSVQYGDGLTGPIQINGPASGDYDIDLGALPLTDWSHEPMFTLLAAHPAAPPTSQTLLVNGTGGDNLQTITFTPGKKHLLRIVNTGINNFLHVGIDQHQLTVIGADFNPIQPFTTDSLVITVGQRYDVVVEANQATDNYYFRIGTGGGVCDGPNEQATAGNTKGAIISYAGAGSAVPTSSPLSLPSGCYDEEQIVPIISTTVPAPTDAPVLMNLTLDTSVGVFWKVNGVAIDIDWTTPTLDYVFNGTSQLPVSDNAVIISSAGWVYYLIVNETPLPHPVHLHGHDFWVISSGPGDGTGAALNLTNPQRRDTHSIAGNNGNPGAGGYVILAFQADNPGAWLLHCHIPFHISGGLGVQFLERPSEIAGTLGDLSGYQAGCASWRGLESSTAAIAQPDSGLKKIKRARKVRRTLRT